MRLKKTRVVFKSVVFLSFLCFLYLFKISKINWVGAISMGGLSILPANPDPDVPYSSYWFVYNLLPGERKEDFLLVKNDSDQKVRVKIYPVDAVTTEDGAFSLKMREEENTDLGAWITLAEKEIELDPGEKKIIPFVIQIPQDASVGDHLGGIVLEREPVNTGGNINIVTRIGVRIYETVPGEFREEAKLGDFSFKLGGRGLKKEVSFGFPVENTGNLRLEPKAKIDIFIPIIGKKIASFSVDNLGMVLPGKQAVLRFGWPNPPIAGVFLVKATLEYGRVSPSSWHQTRLLIYATPLFWLILLGALLLGLFLTRRLKRR